MEGHARAADVRLEKYFPGESFDLYPVRNFIAEQWVDWDISRKYYTEI